MQFEILGTVGATAHGEDVPLGGPKQRLVLALLLSEPGKVVSTDRLVESVWGEDPPSDPRRSLQVYASNLRSALDGVDLEHRDEGYVLHVTPEQVDATRFATLVQEGRAALAAGDPGRAATLLRDALALWRGRPFGPLADEPALAADVARLEELRLEALETRIKADLAIGSHTELVGELRELTGQFPLRERFAAQLMLALYRSGRQAEALEAYETTRTTLDEELGIDPSPSLQALHTQALRQDPALDTPTAAAPVRESAIRTVRGYELVEEIGSGGFGVVYRGRQPGVDRHVAVKIIRPELANDPEFVRRFEVEAQTIARLEHLHIVALYDYWREPDAAYLVMRWLRGGNLHRALRRGPWNLEPAVRLIDQVASALDLAHRNGVVHRDVKPANILLDEEDNAYLSDFGIAGGLDEPPASPGSVPYLAPEHVNDAPLTPATDVFNLGLIAFELLTGRHPYEGESDDTLPRRAVNRPLPPLREVRPELPRSVEQALLRATAVDPDERFPTAGLFAAALRDHSQSKASGRWVATLRNPYKGLRAFHEADATDYYGRERLVGQLLERLAGNGIDARFVTVVGPSGSGKSSLVRAGLVPALRRGGVRESERWFVATMLPGERPLAELERALVEVATCEPGEIADALHAGDEGLVAATVRSLPDDRSELLLVVDQFEELFSQSDPEERAAFTRLVRTATARSSRLRIVLTLRADFYDHPLLDPTIGELVAATTLAVPTLSREDLERAIVEPARSVDVEPEAALTAQIVEDVVDAPGALPLLQYALTEVFDRRADDTLTVEGYREIGGVHGALAGRAEELYAALGAAGRQACHQVFLRLVTVREGTAHTRRRVARTELLDLTGDDTSEAVIETFGRHRLLTFDRDPETRAPTVEVAHEALLDAWGRLRDWIDSARDDLLMHRRLQAAVDEWLASKRDDDYLLQRSRLEEFDHWAPQTEVALTEGQQELLAASRAAQATREQEERARQEREAALERRSTRRLRAVAVVSVAAALVAAALSVLAFGERDRAEQQRATAEQQERIATARGLASAAVAELSEDPERSILLAIEAIEKTRRDDGTVLPEAETTLRRALKGSLVRERLPSGGGLSVAPDGRIATLGMDGTLTVWAPDTLAPLVELTGQSSAPVNPGETRSTLLAQADDTDFSPEGTKIVVADADLRGTVRDAGTGAVEVELENRLARPRFSPDGRHVAGIVPQEARTGFDAARTVGLWDATTGAFIREFEGTANVFWHDFSPDGTALATATDFDGVRLWDIATGEVRWHVGADEEHSPGWTAAFHPDGDRIVVGTTERFVQIRDMDDGALLSTFAGHASWTRSAAFDRDGTRLVTTDSTDARVWDVETGEELFVLRGHEGPLAGSTFTPDGGRVVTTSEDDTTRIWDVSVAGGYEYAALPADLPLPAAFRTDFSPDGHRVATSGADGIVRIWDLETLAVELELAHEHPVHSVAYDPGGELIATSALVGFPDGPADPIRDEIHLWDAETGEHIELFLELDASLWDLVFSPEGGALVIAGNHGELRAVDVTTGENLFTHVHEGGPVYRLVYSPDGERLVVGAQDAGFVLDADTGELLHDLEVDSSLFDLGFVDEQRMVAGEIGGVFRVWDLESGEAVEEVAQEVGIGAVAVDDDLLAIGGSNIVRVRDPHTGARRFEVDYDHELTFVHLSPDGRYLAATFGGLWIHLSVVPLDELLDLARERLTRSFTADECAELLQGPCP